MHHFVENNLIYGAATLCHHGVDVNQSGPNGLTPLHLVAHTDSIEMCELLLAFGADPTILDDEHKAPLDISAACNSQSNRVHEMLLEATK
jgi:tankyrase